jgi:flagellar biosynthesis/type III secretory pathway protein FliH
VPVTEPPALAAAATALPVEVAPPTDLWESQVGVQLAADREAIGATLAAVRQSVAELRADHVGRLQEWQTAAVELALTIASKLLHERVTAGEFPMEAMIRDMAADMHEDEIVTVRLNPADVELLERRLGGEPLLPGLTDPQVIADPTLGRAECRVEGRSSASLSDLPRHLTQIRDDLFGSLAHARS